MQVDSLSAEVERGIRDEYRRLLERYGVRAGDVRPGMPEVAALFAGSGLTVQGWARVVGWRLGSCRMEAGTC